MGRIMPLTSRRGVGGQPPPQSPGPRPGGPSSVGIGTGAPRPPQGPRQVGTIQQPQSTGGHPGGSAPGSPIPLVNTAQNSPLLMEQVQRYRDRFSVDNTNRAIDRSNLGVADSAALLAADAGRANTARRGVSGTGVGAAYLQKNIFDPAQRLAAGKAADIAMGRERDLDALTLGGSAIMGAPDAMSLGRQRLNLDQWSAQSQDARQREDAAQRARDAEIARWQALIGLGPDPYGGAGSRSGGIFGASGIGPGGW